MTSKQLGLLACATFVAVLTAGANAEPSPPPDAAATPSASAADPCGDSNLLATTDRPTFGTNPCAVKPQTAILEFGYRNTTVSGSPGASNLSSYPQNRTRIGLIRDVELVIDTPSALRLTSGGTSLTGDSNIGTGLKWELGYFGSFVDGIAAEVVSPTASAGFTNGLPSFNGSYQIGGGIVKNVGFNLTLGFNSFSSPNPAGGKNVSTTAFQPTLILGGLVAPQTKLNVEVANSSSSGPGTSGQYYGNVFLQHQFAKLVLLDIEAAQRFTVVKGAHQHYFGFGGSFRL
jgi:hypothetical protein